LISENAHWRLRLGYETEIQGEIDLKGFGETKVYRLIRPRSERLMAGEAAPDVFPSDMAVNN
jgi:hypothetical protein